MAKGHHFQHNCHTLLFHNFRKFNIKATADHHIIIQKEVNELLAKSAIEPPTGGAGFYSNMLKVKVSHPAVL